MKKVSHAKTAQLTSAAIGRTMMDALLPVNALPIPAAMLVPTTTMAACPVALLSCSTYS